MSTPFVRDTKLLKATVLPTLINDSKQENTVDVTTAFTGTSSFGLTYTASQRVCSSTAGLITYLR